MCVLFFIILPQCFVFEFEFENYLRLKAKPISPALDLGLLKHIRALMFPFFNITKTLLH